MWKLSSGSPANIIVMESKVGISIILFFFLLWGEGSALFVSRRAGRQSGREAGR